MMGIYLTSDGNNKEQVKYMHKKSTTWETSIRAGSVQHKKSWKTLNYNIPQTMKYPLPAMKINENNVNT